jgi:hypothetical protein
MYAALLKDQYPKILASDSLLYILSKAVFVYSAWSLLEED